MKQTTKKANSRKHFSPYQKVLFLSHSTINNRKDAPRRDIWLPVFYSYFDEREHVHILSNNVFIDLDHENEIIPYEGNEALCGTLVGTIPPRKEE